MNRWTFAAERDAARQRCRAADEFSDHRAKRDASIVDEDRGTRLWNAASARVREIPVQKKSGDERPERGDENSSPACASGRIHVAGQAAGDENERDDDESDERPDHETQHKCKLVFFFAQILEEVSQPYK